MKRRVSGNTMMDGREYLMALPVTMPDERVLVHNHVRPVPRLGTRGFRAWLQQHDEAGLAAWGCGWAPDLGTHYRVTVTAGETA